MGNNLEYKILLNENSDQNSEYPWFLQEFDNNEGKKIRGDFVRCDEIFFIANELRLQSDNYLPFGKETKTFKSMETISGVLHPSYPEALYSMFGNNRRSRCIKNFLLDVRKNKNLNDKEKCHLDGDISSSPNSDDNIRVHLSLTSQQFDQIAALIKSNSMDGLQITLDNPSGFYCGQQRTKSYGFIKILTNSEEHKIVMQDGCKIKPPRLGEVDDFNITIIQCHDWSKEEDKEEGEKEKEKEREETRKSQQNEGIQETLSRLGISGVILSIVSGAFIGYLLSTPIADLISKTGEIIKSFF